MFKKLLTTVAAVCAAGAAQAQLVFSDFSSYAGQNVFSTMPVTQNSGFISVANAGFQQTLVFAVGSSDTPGTINITGRDIVLSARLDSAPDFASWTNIGTLRVVFTDSNGDDVAGVNFAMSLLNVGTNLFTTITAPWVAIGTPTAISLQDVSYVTIGFNGGFAFTGSFDELSIIPEPSTYALLAGLFALGVVGYRRFRK